MKFDWTHNRALGVYLDKYMTSYKYVYVNGERRLESQRGYWVLNVGFLFGSLIVQFNRPKLNEN